MFNRRLELLKQSFHVGPLPNFREWNGVARSQKNEPCRTDFRPLLGPVLLHRVDSTIFQSVSEAAQSFHRR